MTNNQKKIHRVLVRILEQNADVPINMKNIKADLNEQLCHDNRDLFDLNEDEIYHIERDMIHIFEKLKRII